MGSEIALSLAERQVVAGQELHGTVAINYSGRWDSVVINSQIENSSDVFSYSLLNGKKIKHPYARLSIFKDELKGRTAVEFVSSTNHVPAGDYSNVKFRVTLIQEHKEIFSDIVHIKVARA
ncbi:hypothetical protein [Candidatus Nitrososphaera sp. FF02]|uniref:hypothetical protein n=1 Tax=Candidatus Nitrososphaera sp. FF02 TaxID=3398226 RepID=UPI0039EB6930